MVDEVKPVTIDKKRFKNTNGFHLLKPIFYELDDAEHLQTIYTLKEYDHEVNGIIYPSLRRLYVECEDPTEYEFACLHLDGWVHWKKLSAAVFFQPYLKEWREELEVRLRAKALNRIKVRAASNDKDSMQADKILLSGGWKTPEEKTQVGRPTKAKIAEEADKLFKEKSVFDEDYERIMGTANGNLQ